VRTNTPDSVSGVAAAFVSENVAYFVAQHQPYGTANLWATTNGGDSWFERAAISFSFPNASLAFFDESVGYVGLEITLAGPLLKTTDGGLTWMFSGISLPHPFFGWWDEWCRPTRFINRWIGTLSYWMMDEGSTQRAGGLVLSWNRFQDTVIFAVRGYSFPEKGFALDRSRIWVLFQGHLQWTTNGGATWVVETIPVGVTEILYDLYGHQFAMGSGRLFKLDIQLAVEPNAMQPHFYQLLQNYPNPFNPVTTISYQLPTASRVTLKVYDVLGREVATLADGVEEPGYKSVRWDACNVGSGVYFYRLQAGEFVASRKLLLLK
jgi:hypothetical protein